MYCCVRSLSNCSALFGVCVCSYYCMFGVFFVFLFVVFVSLCAVRHALCVLSCFLFGMFCLCFVFVCVMVASFKNMFLCVWLCYWLLFYVRLGGSVRSAFLLLCPFVCVLLFYSFEFFCVCLVFDFRIV